MDNKKAFLFYYEYEEQLKDLSDEELGRLVRAVLKYEKTGKEPQNLGLLGNMAFGFIKGNLNRDRKKYDKRSETSKINGKKGGRPKPKKPNTETYQEPKEPKKADIDIETDTDTVTDIDTDIDTVTEENSISYCEQQFGRTLSPVEYQLIMNWREWFTDDVINFAIDKSVMNGARALSYTEAIINSWHDKGYTTLHECELENKNKKNKKPDWFDKTIEKQEATIDEQKEMEELLKEFE